MTPPCSSSTTTTSSTSTPRATARASTRSSRSRLVLRLALLAALVAAALAADPTAGLRSVSSGTRRTHTGTTTTATATATSPRNALAGASAVPAGRGDTVTARVSQPQTPTSTTTTNARMARASARASAAAADATAGRVYPYTGVGTTFLGAWTPLYWGPQGYLIGPSWFGAGIGGGNWRYIPNFTPFGPPGFNDTDPNGGGGGGGQGWEGGDLEHVLTTDVAAEVAAAAPYEPVLVKENFPCSVYTCRLGVVPTNHSTLTVYTDSSGETWARLKCFLFLDDFEEYGCRQWDRLELSKETTDKKFDCKLPLGIPDTPVWENGIKSRRSELECESRVPGGFPIPP